MSFVVAGTPLGRTLSDWCDDLLAEYLDPHAAAELDQLATAISPADASITVDHGASTLRAQARVEIGDEQLYVWGPGATPNTWTVARGWDGTVAAGAAAGAVVRVNPRWSKVRLAQQLAREVRSWPAAVCSPQSATLDLGARVSVLDLAGLDNVDVRRVLRVQRDHFDVSNASWPSFGYTLERSQDVSGTPSGYHLYLPMTLSRGGAVRVTVGVGFLTPAIDFDNDLGEAYLLSNRLADAAMLGVAGRLLLTSEMVRTDGSSQPRARIAEEVPPGHKMQAGEAFLKERDRLLKLEAEELINAYGIRS